MKGLSNTKQIDKPNTLTKHIHGIIIKKTQSFSVICILDSSVVISDCIIIDFSISGQERVKHRNAPMYAESMSFFSIKKRCISNSGLQELLVIIVRDALAILQSQRILFLYN